jgi:hypothetical protein
MDTNNVLLPDRCITVYCLTFINVRKYRWISEAREYQF